MAILEIIRAKRDGKALSQSEIARFVRELADAKCPPEQAAALAMAIYLNGMNFDETAMLTKAMAASGAFPAATRAISRFRWSGSIWRKRHPACSASPARREPLSFSRRR